MNIGSFNRPMYDTCSHSQRLYESTSPLAYRLDINHGHNCNRCIYDKYWVKYDGDIIDTESELLGITRPYSHCNQFKYSPSCKKTKLCTSTFDKNVPVVLDPSVCPIVYNNLERPTHPGYTLPSFACPTGAARQCGKRA